jgi:radical SAM-linked protein
MPGDKLRFRFAKTGTLRLLSHHDLMRCLERMLRRAELPFKSTAGFHPTPRVVFALSLPLGVAGLDEVVEIEFTRTLDEAETLAALRAQAPTGLTFTRAAAVPMRATAMPRRVVYRVELPSDRADAVAEVCREVMGQDKLWVDRLKPGPKRLNIRPYLRALRAEPVSRDVQRSESAPLHIAAIQLILDLWVTQTGTARAEELLRLLGIADLLDAGVVVERTTVELHDEVPNPDPADGPPPGPAETLPLDPAAIAALARQDEEQPTVAAWGASPAGPVVE